jgi:hypothetical protein
MRPKSDRQRKNRNELQYEQLIVEIPLHRPSPERRDKRDDSERDRGVVVIDLY